ncbi:hypothetical protein ACH5RR_011051 [Cinchona calisaya]|uniref:DUF3730 domain-containing protein n=1 Tax=Cinchona calisaya TaxID=153742 RepID=A0ABD3A798_9GENT
MDAYAPLLERTRVPQPSLQKFAVISIFEKLRNAPPHLDPDSDPGRDAITFCLHSTSASVVDQSVRELCRLVKDSKMDIARGLLELQSALEAADSRFANLFVKALGFLVQLGFQRNSSSFRFQSSENHPFVKILSSRIEVQCELVQQVCMFMVKNKHLGMTEVCDFLRPFLNYSIIRMPVLESFRSFVTSLVSSMASLTCSFPSEAIPLIKLLMGCLRFFPRQDAKDLEVLLQFLECIVDAYVVVLTHLVGIRLLVHEVQLCGSELVEAIFSLHQDLRFHFRGVEKISGMSKHLLVVQKELGLSYLPEFSSILLSFFIPLIQLELEHEQLAILRLLHFLLEWKREDNVGRAASELNEELLFIFPVINIVPSPNTFVKQVAVAVISSLEKILIDPLVSLKKEQAPQRKLLSISTHGCIIYRFLRHLWFQDPFSLSRPFYLTFASTEDLVDDGHETPKPWASLLRDYSVHIIERKHSSQPFSKSQGISNSEISFLLGAITSVFLMHQKSGNSSVDLLAVIVNVNPELGVTLMLVILFYNHIFSSRHRDIDFHGMLLKLLSMLPSLASHPAMVPLIVQTVLPMLHKDVKPVLYATATRLICKTWEISDRVFANLRGVLLPEKFVELATKKDVCISMAASVRDVCRKDPDRGVDLVLSVAACIENEDPLIQSLGLQSLAHLCEADVIDFYTAWDVIRKHVFRYTTNALVASSLCLLLRWGAMDAEVYPEVASHILKILWEVGTLRNAGHGSVWAKARATAFMALTHYEVVHILRSIPDFKDVNLELLFSESDPEVLRTLEEFESRIINFEYMNRRRSVKQKRVSKNKIEKLLDLFPRVIFPTGDKTKVRELPGAALFCLSFAPVDVNNRGVLKELEEVNVKFENALVEIASSLLLSRNILFGLISLQSWKPFMRRWMKVQLMLLDAKPHSSVFDKTSKAASNILKIMRQMANECIPSSAENLALAIGALCSVLPQPVDAVKSSSSKFLLDWLFQYEHEYRQWSAAISLGLVSSCLHLTDHKQKYENINALLEVASISKSTLVKGACGVGLGFSCQDLLARVDSEGNSSLEKNTYEMQEVELLRNIIGVLSQNLCRFSQSSADILQNLPAYIPLGKAVSYTDISIEFVDENDDNLEEDIWGVAGLILGLGSSVSAIYKSGAHDAVINIKEWIFSCIPHLNPSFQKYTIVDKREMVLSVGSCLALPIIVSFCQRVELIDDTEVDHLVSGFRELISELVSTENSGTFHQSLLMASCVGAGNLLSIILNGGLHSLKVDNVKDILSLCRKSYSSPHPPFVHLGGMLGVVSALGADAGLPLHYSTYTRTDVSFDQKQESSCIMGPLLSSPLMENELTSLVREIFLVAQNSDDHRLRQFAAWAISFLRHHLWFRPPQNEVNTFDKDAAGSVSQSLPEDSMVFKISFWLMHLNPGMDATSHVITVISALRCLSYASRLPKLDWGAIIRRCMRYEDQVAKLFAPDSSIKKGVLREECLLFSLRHANQFDSLLIFVDELCDLSRFRTLDLKLQSCLLLHLADLIKIFSVSRLEKLFKDVANFLTWSVSSDQYTLEEKSLLRASSWKGLYACLDGDSLDTHQHISNMENCMKVLFALLPAMESCGISKEWFEAVRCLGKAHQGWLLDLLQTSEMNFMEENGQLFEVVKKIQAKARLVQIGSIPLSELGKLKAYMLNVRSQVIWNVLVEVAATLQQAEERVKRQWLFDTLQISCVTSYPSTALQFLGLLCGNCCKYMPVLVVDRYTVLSDLPVTLASLFLDAIFRDMAESAVLSLWTLTVRIYDWAISISKGDKLPTQQSIDGSENDLAAFLLEVLHHTCVLLKDHLPLDQQIRLANMVSPKL